MTGIPETAARYAAYLESRGLAARVTVAGSRAAVTATGQNGGTLHIALTPNGGQLGWGVSWIHVTHEGVTTCFGQGQLPTAVAALAAGQPATEDAR